MRAVQRLFRIALRSLLGAIVLGAVLAAALLGAVWWIGPATLLDRFRAEALALLDRELSGSFAVERIDGSLWHDLRLHGVTISMDGREVLRSPLVHATWNLDPFELLRGVIRIDAIAVTTPQLRARVDADGDVDFFEVFTPTVDEPDDPGSPVTVLIDRIHFVDGSLRVQGIGDLDLGIDGLAGELALRIPRKGLEVVVPRVAGTLTGFGRRPIALATAVRFVDPDGPATIEIGPVELDSGASRLTLRVLLDGVAKDAPTIRIDATADAAPLGARDLEALLGEWPLQKGVTASLRAGGNLDHLPFSGNLGLAGSRLPVAGSLALRGPAAGVRAAIEIGDLDLTRLPDDIPVAGRLSGNVQVATAFDRPEDVAIDLTAGVDDLQVDGRGFGVLRAEASLLRRAARLHAEIEGESGKAGLYATGTVDDGGASLAGDAFLADFDLAHFLGQARLPRSAVNATARIHAGLAEDRPNATTTLYLAPSRMGAVVADTGVVRLDFRDRTLRIDELRLASGSARLTAAGHLVLDSTSGSRLDVDLNVPRLLLAGDDDRIGGAGSLDAKAELRGLLRSPRLRLTARGGDLRGETLAVEEAAADADVAIDAAGRATGTAQLRVGAVSGPVTLGGIVADVEMRATDRLQEVELALDVDDAARGAHRLHVAGEITPATTRLRLDEVRVGTRLGEWRLEAPADLVRDRAGWTLSPLRIVSGPRVVEARGRVPDRGGIEFAARADGLDLEFLFGSLRGFGDARGTLRAELDGSGTARAPRAQLRVAVDDLVLPGERPATAGIEMRLGEGVLEATLGLDPEGEGQMRGEASLPVEVRFDQPGASALRGPLTGRLQAAGLPLDLAQPLFGRDLTKLRGTLAADLEVAGPAAAPGVRGTFALSGGGGRLRALKVDVEEVEVRGEIAPEALRITAASARSGRGRLDAEGEIRLADLVPTAYDLRLQARRWPAIRTKRYEAQIGAALQLAGPNEEPELTGSVTVEEAYLKPDLAFLDSSAGPSELDATIEVIDTGRPSLPSDALPAAAAFDGLPALPRRIRGDVKLVIKRGTRIRHAMADVNVFGELRIRRKPGSEPIVTGRVESVRGMVEIQGREFRLESAVVTFGGGAFDNPRLDVVASHRRAPYRIEARIGGTVQEPTLALASDPPLEQADILSVLLFGRPATELDEGEQSTLQQQALELTSGYAASVLGQAVSEALGLERLGLDLSEVSFTGGSIGFGRYIGANTYVSVTQHLDEERGREVSIEYFLTPRWKIVTSTDSLGASGADVIWQALY